MKYHIKLGVANIGNGKFDSGVFLKAGSFKPISIPMSVSSSTVICKGSSTTLSASEAGQNADILIYDLSGRMLADKKINTTKGNTTDDMDASLYTGGMYFVKVISESGEYSKKILIAR